MSADIFARWGLQPKGTAGALDAEPLEDVTAVRRGTEAVFERTLTAMFDAMDNLSRTESALLVLAGAFAPQELARLRAMEEVFRGLGTDLEAKVSRSREAARRLEALMRDGQGRLDDLRRLTRAASLVALSVQAVSGAVRADDGALDGLARTMREVLGEMAGLVSNLAAGIERGQDDLHHVTHGAADLQAFVDGEAVPAIHRFSSLIEPRARDKRLARSAALVSTRLSALQARLTMVVTHLQAGDGFRQRLEHVEAILARAEQPGPVPPFLLHRLAAVQLRSALEDLGHALQEGRRHLRALGRMARAIPEALAAGGFHGGDAGGLAPLVTAADRIEKAIEGLSRTSGVLSKASEGLASTLAGVGEATRPAAEFETRMTVLGLNAILLSSRMGSEGRAMVEVAQQLRAIAHDITKLIALLRQDTEGMAMTAGRLDASGDDALAGRLSAAAQATSQISALARMVGCQLGEIAEARSAADIAKAFLQAEQELQDFGSKARALSALADRLDPPWTPAPPLPPDAHGALAEIRRLYSMQAERSVHDRLFPQLADAVRAEREPEDEVLFG